MNKQPLLLDLGGVVFESTGVSNEKIDWRIISQLNNKYGHELNIGADVFPSFLQDYNRLTNQSLSPAVFLEVIWETLRFNKALIEFLLPDFDIYILSDNYRENIEYISKKYNFKDWATGQFYSFEFGMGKEKVEIFHKVIEALPYSANQLLFVDDSQYKIDNARLAGINSILFVSNEDLFESLNNRKPSK